MICPHCGHDNVPGSEECGSCQQDLTQLDLPVAQNHVERSLMEDRVRVLCPRNPVTVRATTTIHDAIRTMLAQNLGSLLVVDERGKLLGVFSERDLLTKVAGHAESLDRLAISRFMTADPETVSAEDTLAYAVHKMHIGGYRHLPVVADGKPSGVISVRDLLRHITRLCQDK